MLELEPGFGASSLWLAAVVGWPFLDTATSRVGLPTGWLAGRPAGFAGLDVKVIAEGFGLGSTDGSDALPVIGVNATGFCWVAGIAEAAGFTWAAGSVDTVWRV